MSDSVGQYLNEIGLVPLLNKEQEQELSQLIERGNIAAQHMLALMSGEYTAEELEQAEKERVEVQHSAALNAGHIAVYEAFARDYPDIRTDKTLEARYQRHMRDGKQAKDEFIRANLRLVVSVARRYPIPTSMELLDLIQEGNLGLEHAVDKFDWRMGFKFSTYATFWIRHAISRALDQKASLVRLPGDRSAALRDAIRQQAMDGGDLDDEHAELHRLTTPTSLHRDLSDEGDSELIDLIPSALPGPEAVVLARADAGIASNLLDVLEPRTRHAVEQRFGLNDGRKRSYREVGEELGVTAEAARRLIKRAISYVREQAPGEEDLAS